MRKGNTLVATLLTVAIMLVLVVALFKGSSMFGKQSGPAKGRPDHLGTTILGQVRYDAKDEVCRSNLNSLRQAIQLFEQTNDDHPPTALSDTKIGDDFSRCPIGHEPYAYDPTTGTVHCVHPGHEKY